MKSQQEWDFGERSGIIRQFTQEVKAESRNYKSSEQTSSLQMVDQEAPSIH